MEYKAIKVEDIEEKIEELKAIKVEDIEEKIEELKAIKVEDIEESIEELKAIKIEDIEEKFEKKTEEESFKGFEEYIERCKTKKDKDKLDQHHLIKYCNNKGVKGIRNKIVKKKVVLPFSKRHKRLYKYIKSKKTSQAVSVQYFKGSGFARYIGDKYISKWFDHRVGRVTFHHKEIVEHYKYKKAKCEESSIRPFTNYFWQPKTFLPFVPSPFAFDPEQLMQHQRLERKNDKEAATYQVYKYLRSASPDTWNLELVCKIGKTNPLIDHQEFLEYSRQIASGAIRDEPHHRYQPFSLDSVSKSDFLYCLREQCEFDIEKKIYKYPSGHRYTPFNI
jgi:hypothetical protein